MSLGKTLTGRDLYSEPFSLETPLDSLLPSEGIYEKIRLILHVFSASQHLTHKLKNINSKERDLDKWNHTILVLLSLAHFITSSSFFLLLSTTSYSCIPWEKNISHSTYISKCRKQYLSNKCTPGLQRVNATQSCSLFSKILRILLGPC